MRNPFFFTAAFCVALAPLLPAPVLAVDMNQNGFSDVWEQRYNAFDLSPSDDPDGDGFSNGQEAQAGTNPFDPESFPKVTLVRLSDGGASQIMFPTENGKWYQLNESKDLSSFLPAGESLHGNGGMVALDFSPTEGGLLQQGLIQEEFWADISGTSLDALRNDPDFPGKPDFRATCESFDVLSGAAASYATRLTALVEAPSTGQYRFYISAGSSARLSISETGNEEDLRPIVTISPEETGIPRGIFDEFDSQESLPVEMVQGERYLLELQFLASRPNSHCQVAWTGPGFSEPVILPAAALVPVPVIAESLDPKNLLVETYDDSNPQPVFGMAEALVQPGLAGSDRAEFYSVNIQGQTSLNSLPGGSSDKHFYASWVAQVTSGPNQEPHGLLSLVFANPDESNTEEGPMITYRGQSNGLGLTFRDSERTYNLPLEFDVPYRYEIISTLDPEGFDYRTGVVPRTVRADHFDLYVSTLDGDLVYQFQNLLFKDLGEDVVQQLGMIRFNPESNPQIIFDDWDITNGAIAGKGYITSNLNGFNPDVDKHFFRISVSDGDQDNDGLSDWEEKVLGKHLPFLPFDSNSGETAEGDMTEAMRFLELENQRSSVSLMTTNLDAFERSSTGVSRDHGEIKLTRTGALKELKVSLEMLAPENAGEATVVCDGNCCSLRGTSGDEGAELADFQLTDREGNVVQLDSVHFEFGEMTKVLTVTALPDDVAEYPETLTLSLVADGLYDIDATSTTAAVQLIDLPDAPGNEALFTGSFSLEPGVSISGPIASGSITAVLNGPRTELTITTNIALDNLSSDQQDSHVHKSLITDSVVSPGPIIFEIVDETSTNSPKPPLNGLLTDHLWKICDSVGAVPTAGGPASKQAIIDSLFGQNGETPLYLNLHTIDFPAGEIWAFLNLSGGSQIEPDAPEPDASPGSGNFPNLSDADLEHEVRRFLNQATFGATDADVALLLSRIEEARQQDPLTHRNTIFSQWLDEQMQLPQSYHLDFVLATNWQHLKTRGIFDPSKYTDNDPTPLPPLPSQWPHVVRENANPSEFHLSAPYPLLQEDYRRASRSGLGPAQSESNGRSTYWQMMINSRDQLRQKMGFALQQIVVVSYEDEVLDDHHFGLANYQDQLNTRAFSYYRDVLGFVNWSPIMGRWLSSIQNQKATDIDGDGQADIFPDENLARENMQLFSIGLFQTWPDGSLRLDETGRPQNTYSNEDIRQFAKILTGQSFGKANLATESWGGVPYGDIPDNPEFMPSRIAQGFFHMQYLYPMKMFGEFHDTSAKTFAGTTIDNTDILDPTEQGIADIKGALDWLAGNPYDEAPDYDMVNSHVSTPAFISKRLIQRFVTSNPSQEYLHRVATVFKDSQGHLGETLKAILLDSEARNLSTGSSSFGKKRSPLEAFIQIVRNFRGLTLLPISPPDLNTWPYNEVAQYHPDPVPSYTNPDLFLTSFGLPAAQAANQTFNIRFIGEDSTSSGPQALQMDPMRQQTVFNYYLPDYTPIGAAGDAGLVAPELQLANEQDTIRNINYFDGISRNRRGISALPIADNNVVFHTLLGAGGAGFFPVNYIRLPLQELGDDFYPASEPQATEDRTSESIADEMLVDKIDFILTGGELKRQFPYDPTDGINKREAIIDAVSFHRDAFDNQGDTEDRLTKFSTALYLIVNSAEFQIQQ